MATKDLGTVTKKTTSPTDPSMPGTSASSTDTPERPVSTGTPITVSQKVLPTSPATSWQSQTAGSSRNTQPTSTNTTLSTGQAYTMPSRQVRKNWQDSQKEKAILRREKKKKRKEQSEKTLKSPESKHPDLRVALALDKIFGTPLGETMVSATSKLKQE